MTQTVTAQDLSSADELWTPVHALAMEARQRRPILSDQQAVQLLTVSKALVPALSPTRQIGYAIRAWIMDSLIRGHLERHPEALIVELGSGFSTRAARLENGQRRWLCVDQPSVIAARRQLLPDTERSCSLASDVAQLGWLEHVKNAAPSDVLVVAEGLLPKWTEDQVKTLLTSVGATLPGALVLFESVTPLTRRFPNLALVNTASDLHWTLKDAGIFERWCGNEAIKERIPLWSIHEGRWPWRLSAALRLWPRLRQTAFVNLIRSNSI